MAKNLCVVCSSPLKEERLMPFCSSRCSFVDLNRWFTGSYAIPLQDSPLDPSSSPEEEL